MNVSVGSPEYDAVLTARIVSSKCSFHVCVVFSSLRTYTNFGFIFLTHVLQSICIKVSNANYVKVYKSSISNRTKNLYFFSLSFIQFINLNKYLGLGLFLFYIFVQEVISDTSSAYSTVFSS